MTRRERLMSIHRGDLPDRPGVKLWGARLGQKLLHPGYAPVYELAMAETDLVGSGGAPFNLHWGSDVGDIVESHEEAGGSDEWVDRTVLYHTPKGTLQTVDTRSTVGKPGYTKEHMLKEPEDIHTLLSAPYTPYPFSADGYLQAEKALGDRGITVFSLDNAMYGLSRLTGSVNFALWSLSHRELLLETIGVFAERIREHASCALAAGLKVVYGWVGPELCIPPLMSPADFDDFVTPFDKQLISMIHEGGGYVWVHCHGKMGPLLERFADMGVDVLNPLEPPPMGDVTLAEAFERVGDRMGLEGNVETHDLMTATKAHIRELVEEAMAAGRDRRFILCPSSGYMEWPYPEERTIENLLTYIREGVRCADAQRRT